MNDRKAPRGRALRYWPGPEDLDPTGSPMKAKDGYPAVVSVARDDDLVNVVVTVDGDEATGLCIKVVRLVPLVPYSENPRELGAHCTWH